MKQITDVSIIIINYNTSKLVLDCLETIKSQTHDINYEVILVDNNSTNNKELSRLKECSEIRYIQSKENLGFGRANNLGLNYATGKYVFFLNSDTLLLNNAIKMMYDFAEQYQGRLGALGTVLEDSKGRKIHSYGQFPSIKDSLFKVTIAPVLKILHIYKSKEYNLSKLYTKVDYITGADLFVKRSVLQECHTFNPSFFMYCEEVELEYRFMKAGYDNILISGPRIIHLEGESSARNGMSRFLRDTIRQQRSEFIYFKLTNPLWIYYAYRVFFPLVRQTLWFNPNVSLRDKVTYMKALFQSVTIKEFANESIS